MRRVDTNSAAFLSSIRHYLASLMEQKSFSDAVSYFEHHRMTVESAEGETAAGILHLASKAYAGCSNYSIALKTARIAQNKAASLAVPELAAEIFMTIGNILRDLSEIREAERAYRDAESIFRRNDMIEGQCRALNMLAGLFFKINDYKNSLSMLMDAVEIAERIGDRKKIAFMMGNIGRIQTFTGNFDDAVKHLKINVELSQEFNDSLETARAYMSLGYVYMQKSDYNDAEVYFVKAEDALKNCSSERDNIILLTYLGELHYRSGRYDDADETLKKAQIKADTINPEGSMAGRILRHRAELALRLKNYQSASRLCAKGLSIMEKVGERVEFGALTKIKAITTEMLGDKKESKALFIKAIDILGETGVRFEKTSAMIAAGKSSAFNNRQRLNFLFRAEEFYARFNLTNKLHKVEKLLQQLEPVKPIEQTMIATEGGRVERSADYSTLCPEIINFKQQLPLLTFSDLPILLTGETGVGKDHLARYFHQVVRPNTPFVTINCASVPETLLESELFGYRKGAFTGAENNKAGLFLAANGGVLFLDEIGDMPLTLQTKLLAVLENRQITPLGGTSTVKLDFKLVTATNRKLVEMVDQGKFRRDLFYRISGLSFEIPPLRKRKEDIPLLLKRFMKECSLTFEDNSIPSDLIRQFVEYDWPGNVRELYNKVRRLELLTKMVSDGDLTELTRSIFSSEETVSNHTLFERVEIFERKLIIEALLAAGGNKSEAARILGIHEATVRTKLKRYDIDLTRIAVN